ncbi:PREDICTED: uncharacterized protein LOC106549361 [Thamnophis sirtalis]|uniref:Uncharacterized protein LOC106549361 n=1 Tax=Thamnophis sirtalis TaxID=35019 RepID=A0A6I9YE64_9SAUR|nr:PREDICTED: uncharacterized protein LOC106549361 [Thamnophis sirtalis]
MCCSGSEVHLPTLQPSPEPLHSLLTHQHPMAKHFSAVWKYNRCFQMTSFGAREVKEGNFMPTFKVQGQVHHRTGNIMVGPQQQPSFLQIYCVGDDDNERDIHCGIYPGVNPQLFSQLQKLLREHNKYILELKAAVDSVPKGHKDFQVVINSDRKPSGEHRGRFNAPMTTEVAVLIVSQDFEKREIVLHIRDNRLLPISETHHAYDSPVPSDVLPWRRWLLHQYTSVRPKHQSSSQEDRVCCCLLQLQDNGV